MAIITDLSFLLENKGTLDAKQNFKTIAEMKAFDEPNKTPSLFTGSVNVAYLLQIPLSPNEFGILISIQ